MRAKHKVDPNVRLLPSLIYKCMATCKVLIQQYDAEYSTYIRFDGGMANSLRISNHESYKGELNYMFNLRTDYLYAPQRMVKDKTTMYFYGLNEVDLLVEHIKDNINNKRAKYSESDYINLMKDRTLARTKLNRSLRVIYNPFKSIGVL